MNEILITNGVTILIALIAGLIALHQVKLNIISSARVKRIEDLRELLSLYCSELDYCSAAKLDFEEELKGKTGKELEIVREKFFPPYVISSKEVLKLQTKSLLYLKSKNPEHNRIEELIRLNSLLLHDMYKDNRKEIEKNIEEIIRIAKGIFEIEWRKAKRRFKT